MILTRTVLASVVVLAVGAPTATAAQDERLDLGISVLHGAGAGLAWLALPMETARANLGGSYLYSPRGGSMIGRLGVWVLTGVAAELIGRETVSPDRHRQARRNGWIGLVVGFTAGNAIGRIVDPDRQLVGGYLGMGLGAVTGVVIALLDDPGPTSVLPGARRSVPITVRIGF